MPQPTQPSDIYSAFTWPRLITLAKILFETRKWVADDAKPERGDGVCGIGYRAWEQTKFAVQKAAAKELIEWLSILDGSAHFIFQLDMMPIRFCRGDSERPLPVGYAIVDGKERAQIELAFDTSGQRPVEGIFRLLVQANREGQPLGVYLVHASLEGETLMTWQIPVADDGTGVAPIVVPTTPVVLPALEVQSVEEAEASERKRAEREAAEKRKAERDSNNERGA